MTGSAEDRVRALSLWSGLKSVTPLKGGVSNASFTVEDACGKYVARVGEDYPCHQVSRAREGIARHSLSSPFNRAHGYHRLRASRLLLLHNL